MLADSALRVIQIQARPCSQEDVFFLSQDLCKQVWSWFEKSYISYVPGKGRNINFVSSFIIWCFCASRQPSLDQQVLYGANGS